MTVPVAIIAAVARNGIIGADNAMPWRLPSDFAHFRRTTMGKPMILGRKTFESIGRALPGRTSIVVTRQRGWETEGVLVAHDLAGALQLAQSEAERTNVSEVIVAGGGAIYGDAMAFADRLYITHVQASPAGDTAFPPIDTAQWLVVRELDAGATERDSAPFRVVLYARKDSRPGVVPSGRLPI